MTPAPRILLVRLAALGDLATASALLVRLRRERPGAHVTWVCGRGGAPLVELLGADSVVTVDERALLTGSSVQRLLALAKLWRELAPTRWDEVYLCHPDARYRLLLLPLRARRVRRFGVQPDGRTRPVRGRSFADEFAALADDGPEGAREGRFPLADLRATVAPDPAVLAAAAGRRTVALVPGGARNVLRESALRRWPVERYVALARRLLADGHQVVLVGDGNDRWAADAFAGLPVLDLVGHTDLPRTLAVLRAADAVVSHDTGGLHLARLVRAPLVALFGPTQPAEVAPEDETTTVLWGGADLACRPCYDGRELAPCASNLCLQRIEVAQVRERVGRFLEARVPRHEAPALLAMEGA